MSAPLVLGPGVYLAMVALAYDELPFEACGLLEGELNGDRIEAFHPCGNAAESSRVYTVDARDQLRASRLAEDRGRDIVGVMHSHTHTSAYPSPTDVAQAPDPTWHYIIVSLKDHEPVLRSFRIVNGNIEEESVVSVG